MEIYRIESDTMVRIPSKELDEEQQLETRLVRTDTARIGGVDILYIGRQGTFGEAGIFDILGVDEAGNTVIVELKRDNAPRSVITQALEYGSEIRNASYESLKNEYEAFVRQEQDPDEDVRPLREAHAEHFDLDEPLSDAEFNTGQRLILVADEFAEDKLLSMVDFLRDHGIDVVAVEYSTFRDEEQDVELLSTDAIRRPLSEEPSASGTHLGPREWEINGREWHLTERTNQDTGTLLEALVDGLDDVESLQEPRWGQKEYIAFADASGQRQFTIWSQAKQLKLKLRTELPTQNEQEEIASKIGIPVDSIQRGAGPVNSPLTVLVCDPDEDPDIEALCDVVEQLLFEK